MTRKDYKLIAAAIADVMACPKADIPTCRAIIEHLGFALGDENEHFSMATFKHACGDPIINMSGKPLMASLLN